MLPALEDLLGGRGEPLWGLLADRGLCCHCWSWQRCLASTRTGTKHLKRNPGGWPLLTREAGRPEVRPAGVSEHRVLRPYVTDVRRQPLVDSRSCRHIQPSKIKHHNLGLNFKLLSDGKPARREVPRERWDSQRDTGHGSCLLKAHCIGIMNPNVFRSQAANKPGVRQQGMEGTAVN